METAQGPQQRTTETVRFAAPGIFRDYFALSASAWNGTGTKNSATDPAAPGDTLSLFATGLGPTDPPLPADGAVANGEFPLVTPIRIWLDQVEAQVLRSGQMRGAPAGVMELIIRVPSGLIRGKPFVTLGAPSTSRGLPFVHVATPPR